MATETDVRTLQKRVWKLESELASHRSRNNIEGIRYEGMLIRRELIIWGLTMAFLMCFIWEVI